MDYSVWHLTVLLKLLCYHASHVSMIDLYQLNLIQYKLNIDDCQGWFHIFGLIRPVWYCSRSKQLLITEYERSYDHPLTHWGRDEMNNISQTTFSNVFSSMKMFEFRFKISLMFVPKGPINNIPALLQIMAWRRWGDKPLSEPMLNFFSGYK